MAKLKLNESNYYSVDADKYYMSASQLKKFLGVAGKQVCEERALAEIKGEIKQEPSDALLLGSLCDCLLTEPTKYEEFKVNHPGMYAKTGVNKGELKTAFQIGLKMVERCKRDKFFMSTLNGDNQTIMTGDIYGVPFKIKMDAFKDGKYITDLKTCRSIRESFWNPVTRQRETFIEFYDYITQGAIYREIVYQNTGKKLPFFISAVSKEVVPDIEVIQIDNETLDNKLEMLRDSIKNAQALKMGEIKPCKCGMCDYCKEKKVLKAPINYLELAGVIEDE